MTINCPVCNRPTIEGKGKSIFCSRKCSSANFYQNNKEKIKARVRKWDENNPEKVKIIHKKAMLKYRTEKRGQFNKLILKSYYGNKQKWNSRGQTRRILYACPSKPMDIQKVCVKCGTDKNVKLKFEVYPNKAEDIRQAYRDGKIYHICKTCRSNQ